MVKKEIRNVKASELTIGLDDEDILYSLQMIEKTSRDKEFDNRKDWLVKKYRVLSQNNLV